MAIKQYVYHKTDENKWKSDNMLDKKPITQLGIQTLPGVCFKVDGVDLYVGSTGIFEVADTQINSLSFTEGSLNLIDQNQSAYLIVDTKYNGGES